MARGLIVVRLVERALGLNLHALACGAILVRAGLQERAKRPPDDLPPSQTPPIRRRPRPEARLRRPAARAADETEPPPPEFKPYWPAAGEQLRLGAGRPRAPAARRLRRRRLVVELVESAARPSCPSCGAECSAVAVRCRSCGFALIEDAGGRAGRRGERTQRPVVSGSGLPWVVALFAAVAAVVAVVVMLFSGGGGSPADVKSARPPAPVPALEAERRLELRFGGMSDDETATVRCPYRIEPRQLVRCELRYADVITRAMLVRLAPSGTLDVAIPYPVTMTREVGVTRRAGPPGWRPVVRRGAR